ncbi:hypothetical protein NC652_000757 [Populus alba x Populus x berolinensis]|nr:hypothetical protein NC652_000757 [Populus alba x Populus x berolinensis]
MCVSKCLIDFLADHPILTSLADESVSQLSLLRDYKHLKLAQGHHVTLEKFWVLESSVHCFALLIYVSTFPLTVLWLILDLELSPKRAIFCNLPLPPLVEQLSSASIMWLMVSAVLCSLIKKTDRGLFKYVPHI